MLKCYHCHGVFSKEMTREYLNGKPHHAYCADVVNRKDKDSQLQGIRLWSPFFLPMLLLPILKIRS